MNETWCHARDPWTGARTKLLGEVALVNGVEVSSCPDLVVVKQIC